MSDPISFTSASGRFGLPYLFSGQAQKEFYVNQAHALTNALLHCAIEGEANTPPASPAAGATWLVGSAPTGAWANQPGKLACFQDSAWLFVTPRDGMSVLNRSNGQNRRFHGTWKTATVPASPSGGTTIDTQARTALDALLAALRVAGIFPAA